jgi:hypothetical protein
MTDTLITVDLQFQRLLQRAREGQAAGREAKVDREQQQKVEAAGRAERGVRERITIPGQVLQQGRSRRGVHSSPQNVTKRPKEQPAAGYVQQGTIGLWGPAMDVASRNNRDYIGWAGVAFIAGPKQRTLEAIGIYTSSPAGLVTPKNYAVLKCSPVWDEENGILTLNVDRILAERTAKPGPTPGPAPYVIQRIPRQVLARDQIYALVVFYEPVPSGAPYPPDRYNFVEETLPDAGLKWSLDFKKVLSIVETVSGTTTSSASSIRTLNPTSRPTLEESIPPPSTANTRRREIFYSVAPIINGANPPRSRPTWWRPPA